MFIEWVVNIVYELSDSFRVLIFLGYIFWVQRFFSSSKEIKMHLSISDVSLFTVWMFWLSSSSPLACFLTSFRSLCDMASALAYYLGHAYPEIDSINFANRKHQTPNLCELNFLIELQF